MVLCLCTKCGVFEDVVAIECWDWFRQHAETCVPIVKAKDPYMQRTREQEYEWRRRTGRVLAR